MRNRVLLAAMPVLLLASCVTEGGRTPSKDPDRKTPVEFVHEKINEHIEQMRYQYGKDLLATVQTIIAYKELAVEPVIAALPDEDARTRATLVYILGFLGGTTAHHAVLTAMNDADVTVRFEAAAALLQLGDWSGVPQLIDFLDSEDRRLRYKAFQSLNEATKLDFGYDFNASVTERNEAAGRWRGWWESRRQEIIFGRR